LHKETLYQTFFDRNPLLYERQSLYIFEPPSEGGGIEATYAVHCRLTGKPVLDFLYVIAELFLLGVTAVALQVNIDHKSPYLKG